MNNHRSRLAMHRTSRLQIPASLLIGLALLSCSKPSAKPRLTYSANPAVYELEQPATINTPTYTGGVASSYAILPALPTGLSFNTTTGIISGTPEVLATAAPYTVTASSKSGSASVQLMLSVIPGPATKMDLLFVVDNSREMAAEQQVLSLVIPNLLNGLLNPACLDSSGAPVAAAMQPPPTGTCPSGTHRDFPPISDVHIGLLSSSLGTFGADGCPDTTMACPNGMTDTANNDHGHLVTRTDPCASGVVSTWNSTGFLAWDPAQVLMPPGESTLGDGTAPGLVQSLQNLIIGDGQIGCQFESQNESWYRFLVDPAPYQSIALNGQTVTSSGMDATLLRQREQFLRPDSLVAIIDLTTKPDTSIKENSIYPLFAQELENGLVFHLPRATSACTTSGPTDPCCTSCGEAPPTGCTMDPSCETNPNYTDASENLALRTFGLESHKTRYGIEFFYQPSRYVTALTSPQIQDETGMMVPSALYSGGQRSPSFVFYAAVAGVPWQLIARQAANGTPDLIHGVNAVTMAATGGFKTSAELSLKDSAGNTFWSDIAGDPEHYVAPLSPFMQEATAPRSGTDPITGIAISPPTSPNGTNPLNGHEYNIASPPGDIEYSCVYPLSAPIDCSQPGAICDCTGNPTADNPLCEPNPNDSMNLTLQTRAKAYPGLKHLAIAEGLGAQGIVASICPSQQTDPTAADYAYVPAVNAIIDAVKPAIRGP